MSAWSWAGASLGAALALGVWLVIAGLPRARQIDLDDRVGPYLDRALAERPVGTSWGWHDVSRRVSTSITAVLDRVLGGRESVARRLRQAALGLDVEGFRLQQMLWALAATAIAIVAGSMLWWTRGVSIVALALVVACAAALGVVGRDWYLTQQARRRERRLIAEFPTVAEMLALSVTAGESTSQALERVARLSAGELAQELEICLAQARTGSTLAEALDGLGNRTASTPITRFVDGLVVALQRGTPLGEVLRAQAADSRESARQLLIEEGGRREIAMMVPVVFLVLPVTVLFAVFPGVSMLQVTL